MKGKVETYLNQIIDDDGTIHISLIDPDKETVESASLIAVESEESGSSAIMVGGSTIVSSSNLDAIVDNIKNSVEIPVILFPSNITGVSEYADAIWFMSLLNSSDAYFISGVQVLSAPLIRKFNLEPIPLGYLITGDGGSAAVVGKAIPIPYDKPELAIAHALAAQYLGMRFVYLEGGSGVKEHVPVRMIQQVKRAIDIPLIVGGGIRTPSEARAVTKAGADIIVQSTVLEEIVHGSISTVVKNIIKEIKIGVGMRLKNGGR